MFKKLIGTKEFYKETISIALPIMLQQFVMSFVNLIDNVMIGSVGASALTSVTVANKFYMVFNGTMFGICGAAGIFIAQFFGAKSNEKCQKVFDINLLCAILIALIFTLIVTFCPAFILGLFTKTPEIMNLGLDYLGVMKYAYIPNAITMVVGMALRAVAINNIQLKIGTLAVLTNTFFNYCFIFGHLGFPMLGVKGAAIATLIARTLEMILYIIILIRKKHFFRLDLKGLIVIDWKLLGKMVSKAIPLTANEILFSVGMAMIFKAYMRVDEYLVAAITVVDTVINIAFIIFGGLSSAISIMIGKRLGANQLEEAKDNNVKLIAFGVFVGVVIGLLMILSSPFIPKIYNLEQDINQTITILLCIKGLLIPVYVFNVCAFFTLRAGGDVKSTLIMDSGFLWCVSVSVSTLVSIYIPISLVKLFILVECLDFIKLGVAFYYLRKGTWLNNLAEE